MNHDDMVDDVRTVGRLARLFVGLAGVAVVLAGVSLWVAS